jgi:hypothetical protein
LVLVLYLVCFQALAVMPAVLAIVFLAFSYSVNFTSGLSNSPWQPPVLENFQFVSINNTWLNISIVSGGAALVVRLVAVYRLFRKDSFCRNDSFMKLYFYMVMVVSFFLMVCVGTIFIRFISE